MSSGELVDRLLPPRLRGGGTTEARRARVAVGALVLVLVLDVLVAFGRPLSGHSAPIVVSFALVVLGLLWWLRLRGNVRALAHVLSFVLVLAVGALTLLAGSTGSVAAAFVIVPLFAVFLAGARAGAFWLVVSIAGVLALEAMRPIEADPTWTLRTVGPIATAIGMYAIAWAYDAGRERDARDLATREQELARARAEAARERADRLSSIGLLAAGMAHEINNPLSYLGANLAYLEQELAAVGTQPQALDALSDAATAVERIRRIVDGLRLYARQDEDAADTLVALADVVTKALQILHNELPHRATIEVRTSAAPLVLANEARLVQVVLNLLVNAAQALAPGAAQRVEVASGTDSEGRAFLEVRDTGAGIAPELLGKVMQPFFTTKPAGVGTGLGLSVCERIVRQLGGTLELQSEVGVGTTARVCLPAADPRALEHASEPSTPRSAPRSGRILIVDDEPLVRRALGRLLRRHEIVEAENGAHALELLSHDDRFDVILSDVMMPEITGIELYRRLAVEHPELAQRVVFMTGGVFDPQLREVVGSFGSQRVVIRKPFHVDELRRVLAERMGRARSSVPPAA